MVACFPAATSRTQWLHSAVCLQWGSLEENCWWNPLVSSYLAPIENNIQHNCSLALKLNKEMFCMFDHSYYTNLQLISCQSTLITIKIGVQDTFRIRRYFMSPREHLQQHSIVSMNHCLYKLTSLANAVLDVTDKFPPNPLTKAHANSDLLATFPLCVSIMPHPPSWCERTPRSVQGAVEMTSILPAGSWWVRQEGASTCS